ncbi:TolC family protein [Aurantibacillus circumpalustris]|uniref:TolC family protein n=1 Tax=Aurantibacillus circumpalustris TaxID=3036359 RepID=UPI00295AE6A3|nr:TolC family protein [Aurantibacillus circumpalustris]
MKNLILTIFLISILSGKSQSAWDLQTCIKYALNHNIGLKQRALNNEVNKNTTEQSKGSALPSLNAGASHVYNFGQTIDRFTNTFANTQVLSQNFYISSNVVLWSGLSQYNNIKSNEYNYLSGVELLKQQQNDLSLSIANAYIGVIFSEEIVKISQNQYSVTVEQFERTSKLVTAGALAKSVEYDIKAQLANELVNVTSAKNNYQISLLTLKQLMNLDSVTNFNIERPQISLEDGQLLENNLQNIYETSLKTQPSIKSNEYSILSAESYLKATKGRISPTLSFNASMGTGTSGLAKDILGVQATGKSSLIGYTNSGEGVYAPEFDYITKPKSFSNQFNDNVNKSLGFTLNIPLYNGLQTHTSIKNAKINALNARFAKDLTEQNLFKSIAQAHANAKAALDKYNASKYSVEAAEESFKYAEQKFNAGVISALDFSTSKNRLFAAESNLLQAKYDYVFKLKVLDYYQGKPLEF